jgi:Lon protease-like protein
MALADNVLPIFPLRVVLFPKMMLPLYIYEDPFKVMITDCVDDRNEFGVILKLGGILHEVGCSADVAKVLAHHEDGRMHIMAGGKRRFRLTEQVGSEPYLKYRVEFLAEQTTEEKEASLPRKIDEVVKLYREGIWVLKPKFQFEIADAARLEDFAFSLAPSTIPHLDVRQKILEASNETDRLDVVIDYYRQLLPDLRKLGGNGGRPSFITP